MKNVMFRDAPIPTPSRGAFDLSHEKKLSTQIGYLTPIFHYDVVPGDKFRMRSEVLVKLSPMLAPVLHRLDVSVHFFYCPYRILWHGYDNSGTIYSSFEDFITGDPEEVCDDLNPPFVTISNANKAYFVESSLADYMGLPVIATGTTVTQDIDINVLPFFAYWKIYDEYYRDENLTDPYCSYIDGLTDIGLLGGDRNAEVDSICAATPILRAYEKDYFKGALPTAYFDKTSYDVELDLDIIGTGDANIYWVDSTGAAPAVGDPTFSAADYLMKEAGPGNSLRFRSGYDLGADATLELTELRRAQAIYKYLEAEMRGGHRYVEMLLGVWGVVSDNAEMDIPQYLGGGRQAVQISSVLNQSQVLDPTAGVNDGVGGVTVSVDPQALETGRGLAVGSTNVANGYFKEHGVVMAIMSVMPRTAYGGAQIPKFFRKFDREDFFVPQLQHIGDQAILQSEIGYDATGIDADDVFGYAPRWSEYKFAYSSVHGAFLSTLDYWHMAEIGDTSGAGPDLNTLFITALYSEDNCIRIFADQSAEDHLFCEIYNDVQAIRPMVVHDIPLS